MSSVQAALSSQTTSNYPNESQSQDSTRTKEAYAIYKLARKLEKGKNDGSNNVKAFELYQQAAELGYLKASCHLGRVYVLGRGTTPNIELGLEILKLTAEKGHALSLYYLGVFHGLPKYGICNPALSSTYLCEAAERNHPLAHTALARKYFRGFGYAPNPGLAERHYKTALQLGCPHALQDCFENEKCVDDLFTYLLNKCQIKFLSKGFRILKAKINVKEITKKKKCAVIANLARLGIHVSDQISAFPDKYSSIENHRASWQLMFDCFKFAADNGTDDAQFMLGHLYLRGSYIENDPILAAHYFTLASHQGNIMAKNSLGALYYTGNGVKQSYEIAVGLWEEAAQKNHPEALAKLGICYFHGNGVPVDFELAVQLFILAANSGYPHAIYFLNCLCVNQGLSQEQIELCPSLCGALGKKMPKSQSKQLPIMEDRRSSGPSQNNKQPKKLQRRNTI
jgi:TPR repeat protein